MNLFNTSCEYILFEPDEEACPNAFQIPLLDSTQTEIFRQDSTTVKRLIIDLLLGPIGFVSTTDVAIQANMMRIALKRWEQPGGAQDPPVYNPMLGDDVNNSPLVPQDQGDFSEMRAIKVWQHFYEQQAHVGIVVNPTAPVWKPDWVSVATGLSAGLASPPLAAGTGGGLFINGNTVDEVILRGETECVTCEGTQGNQVFDVPRFWHFTADMKFRRGIKLRENQNLSLFGGWENLAAPGGQRPTQNFIACYGGIRALVE